MAYHVQNSIAWELQQLSADTHAHTHLVWLHAKVVVFLEQRLCSSMSVVTGHDSQGQLHTTCRATRRILQPPQYTSAASTCSMPGVLCTSAHAACLQAYMHPDVTDFRPLLTTWRCM
jgi:hypothetical protein